MLNFKLERFKMLPRQPGTIWQGGVVRMPAWYEDENGNPMRPRMAIWYDRSRDFVSKPHIIEDEDPYQAALEELIELAAEQGRHGFRPFAIEVADGKLADYLEARLGDVDTRVDRVPSLTALAPVLRDMASHLSGRDEPPSAFSGKGVGLPEMRRFAEAASRFYCARPWDELTDEDLIHIEHPTAPPGMAYVSVMGHGGMTFGLSFFESLKAYEKMRTAASPGHFFARHGAWSVSFDEPTCLPFADVDLWEDHDLPLAAPMAYPYASWFGGAKKSMRRPDAEQLAFIEGLLTALAESETAQMDQVRWTRRVIAAGREVEYRLELVNEVGEEADSRSQLGTVNPQRLARSTEKSSFDLQRLLDGQNFETLEQAQAFLRGALQSGRAVPSVQSTTPLEQAQELMYEAWDHTGRKSRKLVQRALEICPDCADAYVWLAEDSCDPAQALAWYQKGVEAGERALGAERMKRDAGHFWGMVDTRPYMRARLGLAQCLWSLGERHKAIAHYEELLRLNPCDNQGVRYLLLPCLIELNAEDQVDRLVGRYKEDEACQWLYLRALWAYRREGDSSAARELVRKAMQSNSLVPGFLVGRNRMPARLPDSYTMGSREEAVVCAADLNETWQSVPGAAAWLQQRAGSAPSGQGKRTRRSK